MPFSSVGRLLAAGVLLAFSTHSGSSEEVRAGDLTLSHLWTRATPPAAKVAGGFLVISNAGSEDDRLIGGTADFAERVELHEMTLERDVMKMRPLKDGLALPAGAQVTLKPGSFHIMFMGLRRPLKEGDREKGTLLFEKAGRVDVVWKVEGIGARMPGSPDDPHHHHGAPPK